MISFDTLLTSAFGSLVGSMLALAGVYLSHRLQGRRQDEKDRAQMKGVIQGLHDEIETIWESYNGNVGARIEALPDGDPFLMYWPISHDYFTIYNTNAIHIGRIKVHDLRKAIIASYTKGRGLIDSFRMNNEFVQKYEYAAILFKRLRIQCIRPM